MAPICSRTSALTSAKSLGGTCTGSGDWSWVVLELVRGVMKANGRWPFSVSGMPTTLASPMEGWERITCSIWPVGVRGNGEGEMEVGKVVRTCAEAMSCDVDDIVRSRHDMHVVIFIDESGVSRVDPAPIESFQISLVEALVVLEEVGECGWRQWCGHDDVSHRSPGHFVALVVDDTHIEPGHW